MNIRFLITGILLTVMGIGCGTTHHFLPPRPLEKKEWMLSVAWHYDLGRLTPPIIVPHLNAYVGVGKEYNFGFGAQPPFLVNHITFARYFDAGSDDRWSAYFHLNRILNLNNNPEFELGGAFIDGHDTYDQQFMLGLSYGGCLNHLYKLYDRQYDTKPSWRFRIMPVLKYTITGSDAGFSWNHYFGRTKTALASLKHEILNDNDTIYVFQADRIDSIVSSNTPPPDYGHPPCEKYLTLFMDSGSIMVFCDTRFYADAFVIPYEELQYWLGKKYIMSLGGSSGEPSIVLSLDSLTTAWRRGDDLGITQYPEDLRDRIDDINGLIDDNSFGFGIITYQKPKD